MGGSTSEGGHAGGHLLASRKGMATGKPSEVTAKPASNNFRYRPVQARNGVLSTWLRQSNALLMEQSASQIMDV